MSDNKLLTQRVVLELPGMRDAKRRAGIEYKAHPAGGLQLDLYAPRESDGTPLPVVVFVTGYSDTSSQQVMGSKLKDMAVYVSWAELAACSGCVAITYETADPVADGRAVLGYLRDNAAALGIDPNAVGIWSCSGNVPTALALLASAPLTVQCAVLCYGLLLDLGDDHIVADMAARFGFVNAMAGKALSDIPDVPMLIVRAGKDEMPGLNACLDTFVSAALQDNRALHVINHAGGPHAFDMFEDSAASRRTIRAILGYLRSMLLPPV